MFSTKICYFQGRTVIAQVVLSNLTHSRIRSLAEKLFILAYVQVKNLRIFYVDTLNE